MTGKCRRLGDNISRTEVITICSSQHEAVWRLTSHLLPVFVESDSYSVYVPEEEIKLFEEITHPSIDIRSQKLLDRGYSEILTGALQSAGNVGRLGWYLQQFFKIQAMLDSPGDRQIIWDADCVPLADQALFSADGNPRYMKAHEHHPPYFEMIDRLMGFARVQDFSFVIPGFPMPRTWLTEFVQFIEQKNHGKSWGEAIVSTTNFELKSGFSETETLGTWVANVKEGEWTSFDVAWERRGQSRFGRAETFTPEAAIELGQREKLDIVSFENWDVARAKRSKLQKFLRQLRR